MSVDGANTCFSLTVSAPASPEGLAEYSAATGWAAFRVIRESGSQTSTRAVTKKPNMCGGSTDVVLGALDHGSISFKLAYDPADEGAIKVAAQFDANNHIYGMRVLDNGNKRYHRMKVSSVGEEFPAGDEVVVNIALELETKVEDNS